MASPQLQEEGYDVEFVESPPDAFQINCPICLYVLRDPYQNHCCGKYFCRSCIQQIQARKKSCPACNQRFSTFKDKATRQALLKLHVYCKNCEAGCQWTGELGQLNQHLNENPQQGKELTGCEYVEVCCINCLKRFQRCSEKSHWFTECPEKKVKCTNADQGCVWVGKAKELEDHLNVKFTAENRRNGCEFALFKCYNGCGQYVQRNCIETHENEYCTKRPFSCDHCGNFESEYDDVVYNHWPKCDYYPVKCPNKCNEDIQRQDIEDHVDYDCPLTLVECDLKHTGCDVIIPRKHMPAHMIDNMSNHMTLLAIANYNLKHKLATEENEKTRTKANVNKIAWIFGIMSISILVLVLKLTLTTELDNRLIQKISASNELKIQTKEKRWKWLIHTVKQLDIHNSVGELLVNTTLLTPPLEINDKYTPSSTKSTYIFYTHQFGFRVYLDIVYPAHNAKLKINICLYFGEFHSALKWPEENDMIILINVFETDAGVEHCTTINAILTGVYSQESYSWTADKDLNQRYKKNHHLRLSIEKVQVVEYTPFRQFISLCPRL